MFSMQVNKTIKYEGVEYKPNIPFNVQEKDVESIKSIGGILLEEYQGDKKGDTGQDAEIRARAKELGIANYHNTGIDKLKEKIAEKEAEIAKSGSENGGGDGEES